VPTDDPLGNYRVNARIMRGIPYDHPIGQRRTQSDLEVGAAFVHAPD